MKDQNKHDAGGKAEGEANSVQELTAEQSASTPLNPQSIQQTAPKIILVVDDELYQITKSHVHRWVPNFYETIADVTDSLFEDLWEVAKAVPGLNAGAWEYSKAATYLAGDEAVNDVLLSPQFQKTATPGLKKLLAPFTARADWVSALKREFQGAFQALEFELRFVPGPRPGFAEIKQCAAVFLDLFLEQGEASPVESVQVYLQKLANDAGEDVLPPLILMSSHPELEDHRPRFSENAQISAAGLMVLPKKTLMQPEFRAPGLTLAFKQLNGQKDVAHALRRFMHSWLQALETAKTNTARTLWNLDASAMQQIHFASISDDDPYDEHLNEFLSRELLFHVEAQPQVTASVAELDRRFRAQILNGKIDKRLISPLADVKTARSFVSHFTWVGSALPQTFMSGNMEEAAAGISRLLPFGSVLVEDQIRDKSQCLVHITQQCDLNDISRKKDASRTLIFVAAEACELLASSNPIVKSTDLVAKCLRVGQGEGEREYDLQIYAGKLVAMPLSEFLERARSKRWHVVGRLRSDITNHVVAATTNQMSRPASQKMIRPGLLKTKVFLQSTALNGGRTSLIDNEASEARKTSKIFSVLHDEDRYSFEDNASIEIALWLAHQAGTIGLNLEPDRLCTELRRGWLSVDELPGGLRIRVRECGSLQAAYKDIVGGDVGPSRAHQLTVMVEKR